MRQCRGILEPKLRAIPKRDYASSGESQSPKAAQARRILLVEDDTTVAATLAGLFQAQGHGVVGAANGLVALSELEAASFDAALIDLDLPGVDGLTLARMIRAREAMDAKPRLRLIGISARSRGDEEAQCRAAGMDAFLRKPVTGEMLASALVAGRTSG